ncbi:dynein beta chain, ciliary-like [Procambarus clarkii]|uniref:dynein beta chain, ciliary-like n=1 Tax=Procambarus clarkii TaxID=6728 RepID=UPI0037435F77
MEQDVPAELAVQDQIVQASEDVPTIGYNLQLWDITEGLRSIIDKRRANEEVKASCEPSEIESKSKLKGKTTTPNKHQPITLTSSWRKSDNATESSKPTVTGSPKPTAYTELTQIQNFAHKKIQLHQFYFSKLKTELALFIEERMGRKYVEGENIDFSQSFEESGPSTPIFFILSPGVDPLKEVESLGERLGYTCENRRLHNVSLGQGQEKVAEEAIKIAAREGHWVILQNIHLVRQWLPRLEKKLEANSEAAHQDYRVFMSAEPANRPENHILPQGILESAIKITNEPPRGMQANLHKALYNFTQETLEMCSKEAEFKSILFSLCYFHACVAERRKFGAQGWNRPYPFNTGDLTISVNVLYNYLEANSKVPWEDLRYLFGEIMYGGHITDDWDRVLCRTYLEEFLHMDQLDGELNLAPGFPTPPNLDYSGYHSYIDTCLPPESPHLYGLHPNAEIGFLTMTSEHLFKTVFELQPRDMGNSGGVVITREDKVKQTLDEILEKLPEEFNMTDITGKVEERTPYVVVAFQECERMNLLTRIIRATLKELDLGFKEPNRMHNSAEQEALQKKKEQQKQEQQKREQERREQQKREQQKRLQQKRLQQKRLQQKRLQQKLMQQETGQQDSMTIINMVEKESGEALQKKKEQQEQEQQEQEQQKREQERREQQKREQQKRLQRKRLQQKLIQQETGQQDSMTIINMVEKESGEALQKKKEQQKREEQRREQQERERQKREQQKREQQKREQQKREQQKHYKNAVFKRIQKTFKNSRRICTFDSTLDNGSRTALGVAKTSREVLGPATSREVLGPATSREVLGPATSREVLGPATSREVLGPATSREVLGPATSREVLGPATSREVLGPATSREVLGPATSREVLGPATSRARTMLRIMRHSGGQDERERLLPTRPGNGQRTGSLLGRPTALRVNHRTLFLPGPPTLGILLQYQLDASARTRTLTIDVRRSDHPPTAENLLQEKEQEVPPSVWLAGFFNPQSFLTAIMQSTARKSEMPLDQMCLQCDVTKKTKEDFTSAPREGAYVHGLFLEGASWDVENSILIDSRLKELHPQIPVIFIKAITQDKAENRNLYRCPLYKTRQRGPTYVWTFNLKTKEKPAKWILAGVALLLQA